MSDGNSCRQILRSSSIIGGASILNVLVGLVRIKVAAVLLGPTGVGLIGLLQSLMTTAATCAALGFGNVGTRQIAEAAGAGDAATIVAVRRALFLGTLILATLGGLGVWFARDLLTAQLLAGAARPADLGWLAVGVALMVAAGSQTALLNGLRRISDLAWITIGSALLSTLLGIAALLLWGDGGVAAFVVAAPLASFLLGHWYVARLEPVRGPPTPLSRLFGHWGRLARLGAAFMLSGLATTFGMLVARTLVQRDLGTEALGHFQAAWMISMTYIGFVLSSMGTDYYPRLTAAIRDRATTNRLVNEQTEVALLLAGPVFLAMQGLAPWVVHLLYSGAFDEAVWILRWQLLGDILKVASWPLGFVILASGDGRTFLLTESASIGIFVLLLWLGLPLAGVQASGVAFLVMYALYLPLVHRLARRRTGFAWTRSVLVSLAVLAVLASMVFVCALWSRWASAVLGLVAAAALTLYALARLARMAELAGPVARLADRSRGFMIQLGVWRD